MEEGIDGSPAIQANRSPVWRRYRRVYIRAIVPFDSVLLFIRRGGPSLKPALPHRRNSFERNSSSPSRFVPQQGSRTREALRKSSFCLLSAGHRVDLLSRKSISIRPDGYNFDWLRGISTGGAHHGISPRMVFPGIIPDWKTPSFFQREGKVSHWFFRFSSSILYIWISASLLFLRL